MNSIEELLQQLDSVSSTNTYEARIQGLKNKNQDTQRVEKGVRDVEKVLDSGARSFVIYGEPQSGKTEFMIAMTCKLVDRGFKTIFVVMNDNTELEVQNFDRFRSASELNPTPLRDTQLLTQSDSELKKPRARIIFCRKNSKNLQKLIPICRHMTDRFVIDDEADFATPNRKVNQQELTAIHKYLGELGDLADGGAGYYVGVTATPGRLDLNNTFANDNTKWVFLDSYPTYKGRKFFFPQSQEDIAASDYSLVKLPDDTDDPRLLRSAIFSFLVRVAALNLLDCKDPTAYSMLIHTAGRTRDHEEDQLAVEQILSVLGDPEHPKRNEYWRQVLDKAEDIKSRYELSLTSSELIKFIYEHLGQHEILTINSDNDSDNMSKAGNPKSIFTIAIGGNIVSRGVTFERLLSFYFSRNVRGRLQQNTYIQRARMFGNRPYAKFFELSVPETLYEDWAQLFQDHELSLRLAMAGSYAHFQSRRNQVSDTAAIDRSSIEVSQSEHTVGEVFDLTEDLKTALISHNGQQTLTLIERLIDGGLIPEAAFNRAILTYIKETCAPDQKDVHLVLRNDSDTGRVLQNIERYQDGDRNELVRARGGMIHAMLNRSPDYVTNRHFVLPIVNFDGKIRFLYKSNLGHTIFRNITKKTK